MFSIIYPCYYEVKVKSTRIDTFFFEIDIEASGKQFFFTFPIIMAIYYYFFNIFIICLVLYTHDIMNYK